MLGNADNECADESGASVSNDLKMFDVVSHLCLVHMFDQRDPDTFLSLFESGHKKEADEVHRHGWGLPLFMS